MQAIADAAWIVRGTVDGIDAVHDRTGYAATRKKLDAIGAAQKQYKEKQCEKDTAADRKDSPCRRAADTVIDGADTLVTTMESDEATF